LNVLKIAITYIALFFQAELEDLTCLRADQQSLFTREQTPDADLLSQVVFHFTFARHY